MDNQKVLDIHNILKENNIEVGLATLIEVLKAEEIYREQKETNRHDKKVII